MRPLQLAWHDLLRLTFIISLWGYSLLSESHALTARSLSLTMLTWLSLFIAGVAGVSRLQTLTHLYILQNDQRHPERLLERLHALDRRMSDLSPDQDHSANRKLEQAHAKRQLIVTRKIQRATRAVGHKRRLQNICVLLAIGLLIATRAG
jgi:hypothetical protein